MTKEKSKTTQKKKKKKGGISEQANILAQYFCDNIGLTIVAGNQLNQDEFLRQVGAAKRLLSSYTREECEKTINYLIKNPPRGGLRSIHFLKYVIDDVLKTIEYEEKAKIAKDNMKVTMDNTTDLSNKKKYNRNKSNLIKGIGGF